YPLLLQRRDGGVDVVGRGIQAELRYSGGHLSALVADYDVQFIDAGHCDSGLIVLNQRFKTFVKNKSKSCLAEWKAYCFPPIVTAALVVTIGGYLRAFTAASSLATIPFQSANRRSPAKCGMREGMFTCRRRMSARSARLQPGVKMP